MSTPTDDVAAMRQATDDHGRRQELISGARDMAPLMVGYLPFGLLLGAAIARSTQVWAAWSGTLPIYGGSAHLTLVEMLRSGAGLWAAVGAALLINARLLVYSSSLIPLWGTAGGFARLIAAAVIIDPTWMMATRRAERGGTLAQRRAHFVGAAIVLTACWTLSVSAGVFLGGSPVVAGALAIAGPLCLAAIVVPHLRTPGGLSAMVAAAGVTLAACSLPSGTGVLLAMAAAAIVGTIASRRSSC
jgi:predicted branched-subunit amino acid permease